MMRQCDITDRVVDGVVRAITEVTSDMHTRSGKDTRQVPEDLRVYKGTKTPAAVMT